MPFNKEQGENLVERWTNVEGHFRYICHQLAAYSRRLAKVRDEGDFLVTSILKFAEEEKVNLTTSSALVNFADFFGAVQDLRHTQVQQLENRLINDIANYGEFCKKIKDETRKGIQLRVKLTESNRFISDPVSNAALESIETELNQFEGKKIIDIKRYFLEWAQIELAFHSKSLEMFTKAFRAVNEIDEKRDLIAFERQFGLKLADEEPPKTAAQVQIATSLKKFASKDSPLAGQDTNDDGEDDEEEISQYNDSDTNSKK